MYSLALRQREDKYGRTAGPTRCFGPSSRHPANEYRSQSRRDGDVLPPPDRIAYRPAAMTRTSVEGPELLARLCIVSQEVPFDIASKQNVTASHQQRRQNRILVRHAPLFLAGHRIKRVEVRTDVSVG